MFKKLFYINLAIIAVTATSVIPLHAQYAKVRLGVLPFRDSRKKITDSGLSHSLATEFGSELSKYKFIQLIERSQMRKILKEIELSQSGLFNEKSAAKAGRLQGLELMLLGNIDRSRISGRLIHVESGKILGAASITGRRNLPELAKKMAEAAEIYLVREKIKSMRNESADINLQIWIERVHQGQSKVINAANKSAKVQLKDKVIFKFQANRDGYMTIVNIQPGGDVVILYPNDLHPENQIRAGETYTIPGKTDNFHIVVTKPLGIDTVVFFFTKEKVEWLDRKKIQGQGFWTVKQKEKLAFSRGLTIQATSLVRKDWESRVLELEVSE